VLLGCAKSTGTRLLHLAALGHTALDVVKLNVVGVVGLDVGSKAVQGALDGLLGRAVHHAGLPLVSTSTALPARATHVLRGIIRRPGNEGDLGTRALAVLELVLDVEDGVAAADALLALAVLALGVEQLLAEHVEVGLVGCLLNDNLLPVVADLVDDPLEVLAELQLVEGADALGCDGDTGTALLVEGWRQGERERWG
jgi:hypothetical protein